MWARIRLSSIYIYMYRFRYRYRERDSDLLGVHDKGSEGDATEYHEISGMGHRAGS